MGHLVEQTTLKQRAEIAAHVLARLRHGEALSAKWGEAFFYPWGDAAAYYLLMTIPQRDSEAFCIYLEDADLTQEYNEYMLMPGSFIIDPDHPELHGTFQALLQNLEPYVKSLAVLQ